MKKSLLATTIIGLCSVFNANASTETDALRAELEKQKQTLAELEKRLAESEKRAELTAEAFEQVAQPGNQTTIGGYGELHYNNLTNNLNDSKKREFDFHRFVLFVGHEFNSSTRFFSEVEIEHAIAGEGQEGEIELEQAYIEHDINADLTAKGGLFLMPVGIINETHEPDTFYGVERNPVEKNILPATWWEAGAALNIKLAPGVALDTAVTSGLNTPVEGGSAYSVRSGRQKVAKAKGDDLAYTGRIKYTAIPGLELAATLQYQSDLTQSNPDVDTASATLFSAHAIYSVKQFSVRALYAQWNIDGQEAEALGRDEQRGFYIEPSYRINDEFGVFARYNEWDNNAGNDADTKITQFNMGVNYWLHENAVIKFDYEKQGGAADTDGFNLGLGYQF